MGLDGRAPRVRNLAMTYASEQRCSAAFLDMLSAITDHPALRRRPTGRHDSEGVT